MKYLLSGAALGVVLAAAGAAPVQAVTAESVANFEANQDEAHLVKHHGRLFSLTETDGNIVVHRADVSGENWVDISDAPTVDQLTDHLVEVTTGAIRRNRVFVSFVNDAGEAEVWSVQRRGFDRAWHQVGADGLGDSANTEVTEMMRLYVRRFETPNPILAFTKNEAGAGLYLHFLRGGWIQEGEFGLGQGIDEVVAAAHLRVDDVPYIYAATPDGSLYRAAKTDLTTWEAVTTVGDEVTAMRNRGGKLYVAVIDGGVPKVLRSEDGSSFTQVGADSLGNVNNTKVNRIFGFRRGSALFATTVNETDGAELHRWNPETDSWELVVGGGLGNANNATIINSLIYSHQRYLATKNASNGAEIYRLVQD
jgi:hypothetical protein